MMRIMKWAQKKLADTVDNIWCIHCGEHRTIIRHDVVETPTPKRLSKRMIGECTTCEKRTSTFI